MIAKQKLSNYTTRGRCSIYQLSEYIHSYGSPEPLSDKLNYLYYKLPKKLNDLGVEQKHDMNPEDVAVYQWAAPDYPLMASSIPLSKNKREKTNVLSDIMRGRYIPPLNSFIYNTQGFQSILAPLRHVFHIKSKMQLSSSTKKLLYLVGNKKR